MSIPGISSMIIGSAASTKLMLSVPYGGYSMWDLDEQGPLIIDGPYVGIITPISGSMVVEAWGAGGAGGGIKSSGVGPTGNTTSWIDGSNALFAGGGLGGRNSSTSNAEVAGGAGGTALGGDVNLPGGNGGRSDFGSDSEIRGGTGGASPNGGAARGGQEDSGAEHGYTGNAPGGGGSGAVNGYRIGAGGGGGAAYAKKTFTGGSTAEVSVAGPNLYPSGGTRGGHGAAGRLKISLAV